MTDTLTEASTVETNVVNAAIQDGHRTFIEYERKVHQLRKLRFMKTRPSAPKPFQRVISGGVRSPLSYRLVQAITGMVTKERPAFKRLPLNKDDRDSASRLQASADPMLQDLERLASRPLYYNFIDAMVADGSAVMKCYRDSWQGFPERGADQQDNEYNDMVAKFIMRGASHPLRMRQVDVLNFKYPLVDYDPPYVIEEGKRPTLGAMTSFGLYFGVNNKLQILPDATAFHTLEIPTGVAPLIDVEEVWRDDEVFVRIGGTVYKAPNKMGFKPYVWAQGETSSHPDPALSSLSVLYPYAGLEPWLNTMLTVLASWGVIGGTPIMYTSRKLPPGAGGVPDSTPNLSDIPLGKRIDLGLGGEIGFVTPPPVGREVLEFINFLVDFMDRAGLSSLAYGQVGTRMPGTSFQMALEQALAKINPIVSSAQIAVADIVKMQWKLVEQLGKPIFVTGDGLQTGFGKRRGLGRFIIDPKDIGGYYDLHAKIRVGSTQDAVSRGMHAAFMREKGLWSRDRAMEYSDVDDPFREYQDIMGNKLEESPLITQLMLQQALEQEPELAKRAQSLAAQGVDVGAMLMGVQPGATPQGAPVPGFGGGAAKPAGAAPAPKRGGRPTSSPKNPGGPGHNAGSRGHA